MTTTTTTDLRARRSADVDTLNSFLRGEMSAAESYLQALEKLADDPIAHDLRQCYESHAARVSLLRDHIASLGGSPSKSSGAWGALVSLIEGGAKLFGKRSAVAALEQGEDIGRSDYNADIDELSAESRQLVEKMIVPEQERTHGIMSRLKRELGAAAGDQPG
jgi:uncharacterized protein (TIGR02284 family)